MFLNTFHNKKTAILAGIAVFLLITDRFFKTMAINGMLDQPINCLGNILKLFFTKNYFIAFSLPIGNITASIISTAIICLLLVSIAYCVKKQNTTATWFLLFIVIGAASNLLDRIKYGYVIDYLDLKYFTVFNLADALIILGVLGLLLINKNNSINMF